MTQIAVLLTSTPQVRAGYVTIQIGIFITLWPKNRRWPPRKKELHAFLLNKGNGQWHCEEGYSVHVA